MNLWALPGRLGGESGYGRGSVAFAFAWQDAALLVVVGSECRQRVSAVIVRPSALRALGHEATLSTGGLVARSGARGTRMWRK
jgi:hypothetical protein